MRLGKYLLPNKFRFFRELRTIKFNLLDVGCANHSASLTKHWFPSCNYFGLDREIYNNDPIDFGCMERFYKIDLENSDLTEIPDGYFQVIVFSHVIEHLSNGLAILEKLTHKLSKDGKIYVEFPSQRSLSLPSAKGSLNFCDDESHIRLYDIKEVANVLLDNNIKIVRGGVSRDWRRVLISLLTVPIQFYYLIRYGKLWIGLWDLLGFANYVYGERRTGYTDIEPSHK